MMRAVVTLRPPSFQAAREHIASRGLGLLPPPLAGEGWGGGEWKDWCLCAPTLSLPRKRERGRRGASLQKPDSMDASLDSFRGALLVVAADRPFLDAGEVIVGAVAGLPHGEDQRQVGLRFLLEAGRQCGELRQREVGM